MGLFISGIGFAIFVGAQWNRIEKAEASITAIKTNNLNRDAKLGSIDSRLSRIEGMLEQALKKRGDE